MIENILMGIELAVTWQNLIIAFAGVIMGITFGALPGFTAAMGVAVLIPLTYGMNPVMGLILLAAVYCGAIYGGSITAILLHTPGTPAAAATAIDGYEMTKQGKASEALTEAICASFWGGIFSAFALLLIGPPLAKAALKFGPPEYFMLGVFGLTIIVTLTAKSLIKGIISGILGLIFGTVGMDPLLAFPRYTFGQPSLMTGVSLVPALIGLFSISQVLMMVAQKEQGIVQVDTSGIKGKKPRLSDLYKYPVTYIRSSIIGTFIGMLPGAGASIAAFLGYNEAKRFSKTPEKFGTGLREAVGAAEAANNGVTGGSLITLLTLGIPGNSVTAILLGGLMIQGLRPGNELFTTNARITYPFLIGLFIANIFMLLVGLFGSRHFAHVVKTPVNILATVIIVLGVMGSYAINNNMFDVYVMMFFGLLGYLMRTNGFDTAPVVLGIILGPIAEKGLTQSFVLARGESIIKLFLSRPITLVLIVLIIISLATPFVQEYCSSKKKKLHNNANNM
jgi:putative tricarboxylic transport membrane protein